MLHKIIGIVLLMTISTTLFAQYHFAVEVTNLRPGKGHLYLGLYDKKKDF